MCRPKEPQQRKDKETMKRLVTFSKQNTPVDFSRLDTQRGAGFILQTLKNRGVSTKAEVIFERDHDGFAYGNGHGNQNTTWAVLLNNNYIRVVNGYRKVAHRKSFRGPVTCISTYTYRGVPPKYIITDLGLKLLETAKH